MATLDLKRILKFQELLHAFALVERGARVRGRELRENDAEHSFSLAMLTWFVIDAFDLPLNKELSIQYALAHDLVEVYAGDTLFLDPEGLKTKYEREEKARVRIAEEFPEFPSLHETILAYEKQEDAESKFVKALDKVDPVLTNFAEGGRLWKERGMAYEDLVQAKREKVAGVAEVKQLLEDIIADIEPRKGDYFPK